MSAMNAPWTNITGSPIPETSYSSSDSSVLALSTTLPPSRQPGGIGGVLPKPTLFGSILLAATLSVARVCADRRLYFSVQQSMVRFSKQFQKEGSQKSACRILHRMTGAEPICRSAPILQTKPDHLM
jgi:hypothetical protein